MKGREFALFGISLLAGLTGGFSLRKKQHAQPASPSPLFYAGTWQFVDPHNQRHHRLAISPNLDIEIDGRPIEVSVQHLDDHQLTFQDKFGYHLVIHANEKRPISFFDEADDCTYTVHALETPHHD
ncbi:DUF4828 domain-containing protein [Levilactobacillus spicheri]|uniref:DUF4828 domain-containing protein n=2 Tax=Levilactobacillus spicheri TaxID=216463 RepID=A0A0F3RNV5_9LACO|nr:DUF4828 domain-containing protein [Levilactobacillus spicheri]KJW11693.1 membrane protein [Levilactobacillus spicheri]KRL46273.1 hypothetical protein FD37_GL000742 [Levilactobacillus spicheri DSM 15429]GEO67118.1 DUF4828 domain-containing protein [Levilactobacillus spicheri]